LISEISLFDFDLILIVRIAIEGIFIVVYIPAILARFHKLLNWRLRINTYVYFISFVFEKKYIN